MSLFASVLHAHAALTGSPVPSGVAMRLLTYTFLVILVPLAALTRRQPGARRAVWAAALAAFAVSALHLSQLHQRDSSWPIELLGHHASVPLAFAILDTSDRIPVRRGSDVVLVPQIASIVAEGELLHLTTIKGERYTISYRLKDLETRLDPERFVRLGRGTIASVDLIAKVSMLPGGTHIAILTNGHKLRVSL